MIQIKPIQSSDNLALSQIIRESLETNDLAIPGTAYFDPELTDLTSYYQASPNRQYFVAKSAQGVIWGGTGIAEYDLANKVAELQKLYLVPAAQGHHLSYQLLDAAVAFAKQAGYQQIYLETHHNLKAAIHTYQQYGFSELSQPLNNGEHSAMDRFFALAL